MNRNMFGFLTDIRKLAVVAILIGLAVAIRTLATIDITPYVKVDFGMVAIVMAIGILFGPLAGALSGGIIDLIQYIIKPTGFYNPFVTIGIICYGLIAGFFYFRKNENAKLLVIEIGVTVAYLTGFIVMTLGFAWALSVSTNPKMFMPFNEALPYVTISRLLSLLHFFWYIVLTPALVVTGEKLMADWQKK